MKFENPQNYSPHESRKDNELAEENKIDNDSSIQKENKDSQGLVELDEKEKTEKIQELREKLKEKNEIPAEKEKAKEISSDSSKEVNVEQHYKNGNLECVYENLSDHHLVIIKKIIDNIAQYLDHKVLIIFKDFIPHNPGFHSSLNPEFKDPEDADSIHINSNFWDKTQIIDYLLHELGHAFECQLERIAKENNLKILPDGADIESDYFKNYSFGECQADFIQGFIVNNDYVKNNLKSPLLENIYKAVSKLFKDKDFSEIRKIREEENAKYKKETENQYELGKTDKPAWLMEGYKNVDIYLRAFDPEINAYYKKHFNDLEEKFKS
ncbi:hypothetical protein KKG58_01090 [Patescibacteria group bacterium]|nr:hypothetical protein [Patescibacteria group bacterium]